MTKNTLLGRAFIAIALVSLIFAIVCFTMESGYETWDEKYGGDAYTGIQNAAADTACNVVDTNNIIKTIGGFAFIIVGFAFGTIGFANLQEGNKPAASTATAATASNTTAQSTSTPEKAESAEHTEL